MTRVVGKASTASHEESNRVMEKKWKSIANTIKLRLSFNFSDQEKRRKQIEKVKASECENNADQPVFEVPW